MVWRVHAIWERGRRNKEEVIGQSDNKKRGRPAPPGGKGKGGKNDHDRDSGEGDESDGDDEDGESGDGGSASKRRRGNAGSAVGGGGGRQRRVMAPSAGSEKNSQAHPKGSPGSHYSEDFDDENLVSGITDRPPHAWSSDDNSDKANPMYVACSDLQTYGVARTPHERAVREVGALMTQNQLAAAEVLDETGAGGSPELTILRVSTKRTTSEARSATGMNSTTNALTQLAAARTLRERLDQKNLDVLKRFIRLEIADQFRFGTGMERSDKGKAALMSLVEIVCTNKTLVADYGLERQPPAAKEAVVQRLAELDPGGRLAARSHAEPVHP